VLPAATAASAFNAELEITGVAPPLDEITPLPDTEVTPAPPENTLVPSVATHMLALDATVTLFAAPGAVTVAVWVELFTTS
jgi:hypothetical protein